MNEKSFDLTDLELLKNRFERAWQSESPPSLKEFLPKEFSDLHRGTIHGLIAIDLQYRWQKTSEKGSAAMATWMPGELPVCPRLEDYFSMPELKAGSLKDLPVELVIAEYRARYLHGDPPSHLEYANRFPALAERLLPEFAKLDELLASQEGTSPQVQSLADTQTMLGNQTPEKSPSPAAAEIPLHCGDYELLEELGKGGMGVVFKARQMSADRIVALKLIRPDQLSQFLPEQREQVLARFRNEVQAAARLEHDHVVTVYDVGEYEGQSYYAMRYVDGESLRDKLNSGPLEPLVAARYMRQVSLALAEAHSHHILHRDLKPHNVMVSSKSDRAMLADFGLAKLTEGDQHLTASQAALGSPPYMSPEQTLHSADITAASDIYGLGATLYHLLTGRPPFMAASAMATMLQVQTKEPVSPRVLNPAIPLDLETITLKCLEKEPAKRYASASELAEELERFEQGEPILARPVGRIERAWRWCKKNRGAASAVGGGALAAVLAVVTLVVLYSWSQSSARVQRIALLSGDLQKVVDAPTISPAYLENAEPLLRELSAVDPSKSAEFRRRLQVSYAAQIETELRRPSLPDEQAEALKNSIAILSARDENTAARLQKILDDTIARWQHVIQLTPPFVQAGEIFGTGNIEVNGGRLFRSKQAEGNSPVLLTNTTCRNQVRMEAIFAPGWEQAGELGLILNGSHQADEKNGYALLLSAESGGKNSSGATPVSFASAKTAKGAFTLVVKRGEIVLRKETIAADRLPPGELIVRGRRNGPQVELSVAGVGSISFHDPFSAAAGSSGVFGVVLPSSTSLLSLMAEQRNVSEQAGTLGKIDAYLASGRFTEALAELQRVKNTAQNSPGYPAAEVEYKLGLCQMELGHTQEAQLSLAAVCVMPENEWTLSATARQWLLNVRSGDFEAAESQLLDLGSRYQFEDLASIVPDAIRQELIDAYLEWYEKHLGAFEYFTPSQQHVRHLERLLHVQKLWHAPEPEITLTKRTLGSALFHRNEFAAAEKLYSEALAAETEPWAGWLLEDDIAWLQDLQEGSKETILKLEKRFYNEANEPIEDRVGLAVPMARLYLRHGEPQKAKECMEHYFRVSDRVGVLHHLQACLVRGYVFEALGDTARCQKAWKEGFDWAKKTDSTYTHYGVMLGSLADEISVEDSRHIVQVVTGGGESKFLRMLRGQFLSDAMVHSLLRRCWQTPYGKQCAREIALHEVSQAEFYSRLMNAPCYEVWRQLAVDTTDIADFSNPLSPEVDAALRKLVADIWEHIEAGRLGQSQFLTAVVLRNGYATESTWNLFAQSLPENVRGASSYFFARRFFLFKKTELAKSLYLSAIADEHTDWRLKLDALERLKEIDPQLEVGGRIMHRKFAGRGGSWGPESRRIVRLVPNQESEPASEHLVVVDTETGEETELGITASSCAWSPVAGGPIAFAKPSPHEKEVWLVEDNGHNPRKLADGEFIAWSEDGQSVVLRNSQNLELHRINLQGEKVGGFPIRPAHDSLIAVSPDGGRIAYTSLNRAMLTVRSVQTGAILCKLTLTEMKLTHLNWSPRGEFLAISGEGGPDALILDVAESTAIPFFAAEIGAPNWSPNGNWLVLDDKESGEIRVYAKSGLDLYRLKERPVKLAFQRK